MRSLFISFLVFSLILVTGCGDDATSEPVRMDAQVFDLGMGPGGDGGAGGGGGNNGGPTEEHTRLSYIKSVTPRGMGTASVDLVIYDFEDDEEFNLTGGQGVVNCVSKLCRLNKDMTWIGWLEPDAVAGGFRLKVAPIDLRQKVVQIDRVREVNDRVNSFDFTTFKLNPDDPNSEVVEELIYTRGQAMGSDGTIDVWVEPVAGASEEGCEDAPYRCRNLVGTVNANGGFRVTDSGSLIILIETTLSTMTLKFYNLANTAQQTLYTFGEQNMTGSQFSGRLPIALSPDATYLAVFTNDEFIWNLHTLQARPMPPEPGNHVLFEGRTHPQGDCRRMGDYYFNEVRFNPVFSSDSEWIYFLARGDCSRRGDPPTNRDDFDILRINRNLDGAVENVTNNLRASHWSNHDIGDFALSPDGTKLVFTAERMNNVSSKSIWVINPEDGSYDCSRNDPLPVLDARERCEFVFDDRSGADIVYRDLRFHKVQVPR